MRLILNSEASKAIEWHCKHYTGRGLMNHHKSGEDLAKEMGVDPKVLQKTCTLLSAARRKLTSKLMTTTATQRTQVPTHSARSTSQAANTASTMRSTLL
jgi:hypothetical protein